MRPSSLLPAFSVFLLLAVVPACLATPTPILGNLTWDLDPFVYANMSVGDGPNLPYKGGEIVYMGDCVIGEPCEFNESFTVVGGGDLFPTGMGHKIIWMQIYFDMVTAPVTDLTTLPDTYATGTFTGKLGIYDCAPLDDMCGPYDFTLQRGETLDQGCGDELNQPCTYGISGVALGYTGTYKPYPGPTPSAMYDFLGTANLVPEPSSLAMLSTGLIGAAVSLGRKLFH